MGYHTPSGTSQNGWKSWLPYLCIALILVTGTIWGALFFLAVVWILRKNPGADTYFTLSNNEKKTARWVYTWLFLSPIITVPIFIGMVINLPYNSPTVDERVLAALIPLIIHAPLLLGLTSKSAFVYRHTQQGILLIALRAGVAGLAIGIEPSPYDGLGLFLLGNGGLWLFGSIVGWSQISNGKCWFMESKGERIISSESAGPEKPETPVMDRELDDMLKSLDSKGILAAKQKALHAFQTGTPAIKKRAVEVLSRLGEVEKF